MDPTLIGFGSSAGFDIGLRREKGTVENRTERSAFN
jgi:hypothetical protein